MTVLSSGVGPVEARRDDLLPPATSGEANPAAEPAPTESGGTSAARMLVSSAAMRCLRRRVISRRRSLPRFGGCQRNQLGTNDERMPGPSVPLAF
jgi:hypothetical protein